MTKGKHYEPGAAGWVIRSEAVVDNGKKHVSWWYGPDHGWGTTWGGLDYSVRVWRLRRQALDAFRSGYGGVFVRGRFRAQKVEDAEHEQAQRKAAAA